MKTHSNSVREQNRTPKQSDNNSGTIGQEGGIDRRKEQKPFVQHADPHDKETGNKEYDRHHKEDRVNRITAVSAEEENKKGEINESLPGNRSDNKMTSHAENSGGTLAEDQ